MKLDERSEEVLENLWLGTQEGEATSVSLGELPVDGPEEAVARLLQLGYISRSGDELRLTERGRPEAASVVRRCRLAERLLTDVLSEGDTLLQDRACQFEHLLDRGLDDSICTLLGHPKLCPHGKPIPQGRCCQEGQDKLQRLVSPLPGLRAGQGGRIAYIYAPRSEKLQKLMSLGILPGASITLLQSFLSYVFQVGQTHFAVDRDMAEAIYVRLEEPEPELPGPHQRRRWWRFGLGPRA